MSLESVQHYVTYNVQHKVLICKEHQYGITDVVRHFRGEDHSKMSTKTRLKIRAATQHLELANPNDMQIPSAYCPPIDGIELFDEGAQCKKCGYLAGASGSIEEHCRKQHDWKAKDEPIWMNQAVQTFYQGIIHSIYALI